MSGTNDIYKHAQGSTLRMRRTAETLKFQQLDEEVRQDRIRYQSNCRHLDLQNRWAFNLVHNFPDRKPRAICSLCLLLIQPRHFDSGGPNEIKSVDAHPLYPVVQWMENKDYKLVKLEYEFTQIVDGLLGDSDRWTKLAQAERNYAQACAAVWDEFDTMTRQYKLAVKGPGK